MKKELEESLIYSYFEKKDRISGEEILSFCDEKQINMFILYLLMKEWKTEAEQLKSPYFDFNSKEVKSALTTFMNTLSKNVSIHKNDFQPLLHKAINYTFQLVENPESFVVSNKLDSEILEIKRYIQYHMPYFDGDISYDVENKTEEVLIKLNLQTAVIKEGVDSTEIDQDIPVIHEKLAASGEKQSIHETLNEGVEQKETRTSIKIDNIKKAITINQQFSFVSKLFNGDTEQYKIAITRLENCESLVEAEEYLNSSVNGTENLKELEELNLLIQQKFNFTEE